MSNLSLEITKKIILEQELIIGPLAWEEAAKVDALTVSEEAKTVEIKNSKNQTDAINKLVKQYERLFGRASVEACKDAVKDLLPKLDQDQVPEMLR
jgi:hypothetical protein